MDLQNILTRDLRAGEGMHELRVEIQSEAACEIELCECSVADAGSLNRTEPSLHQLTRAGSRFCDRQTRAEVD